MNRACIAALLRKLADAIEEDDPPKTKSKEPRKPRAMVRPLGEAKPTR